MRILQVCPYAWNASGGVQSHIISLSRELRSRGHDVLVAAPFDPGLPVSHDSQVHLTGECRRFSMNGSVAPICLEPHAWWEIKRTLGRFAPDIVHVHEPLMPSLPMAAAWFSRAPVVATFHMHCPGTFESIAYSIAAFGLRPLSRRFDLCLAVSQAAATSVARRVRAPIAIVPNGVEIERFSKARPMDLPGTTRLLFVNRLDRRKGFDVALRAFAQLAGRIDGLQLIVAGDGPCRRSLADVSADVRRRVTMLGDVREELPSVYQAADLFLAPARGHESFGIVLLEAMAAGLPVVASDIDGYREVVRHDQEALLVPPGDAGALAAAAARVLGDRELGARLTASGQSRVRQFAWDVVTTTIERHYALALDTIRVAASIPVPSPAPDISP